MLGAAPAVAVDDYVKSIETSRAERLQRLTAVDGWLTLVGLHFLPAGESTLGSAPENRVVLATGPRHLGTIRLAPDGVVTLTSRGDVPLLIDGKSATKATLGEGGKNEQPTLVKIGTMSFFVIERGGKKALRVRDSAAKRRTNFLGIDYFPIDPVWRIEARWEPFEVAREISIENILGQISKEKVPGKAVFQLAGRKVELLPIAGGVGEPLFFVISDLTSGKETYEAARFVYADPPSDGKIVLDFNRAMNPPCAFTPFATCPLPPKENHLPVPVTAGEKKYRGEH